MQLNDGVIVKKRRIRAVAAAAELKCKYLIKVNPEQVDEAIKRGGGGVVAAGCCCSTRAVERGTGCSVAAAAGEKEGDGKNQRGERKREGVVVASGVDLRGGFYCQFLLTL